MPADFVQPEILVSLGPDSRGRTWIGSRDGKLIAVDPMTARLESVPARGNAFALLGNDVFTVEDDRRVVRTDYTTGARTVLYPR